MIKKLWCSIFHFSEHEVISVGNWVVTTQCKKCGVKHYDY